MTDCSALTPSSAISDFLLKQQEATHFAPVAVAGYAQGTGHGWEIWGGGTSPDAWLRPFDLASVSKPFTALAAAYLVRDGAWSWETPLKEILPELGDTWGGLQTIESLLSHRSGLKPHLELFRPSWSGAPVQREQLLRLAAKAVQEQPHRTPLYSDLGYLLVGHALERTTGQDLDVALSELIFVPWHLDIGSARSFRKSIPEFTEAAVPTEIQPGRGGALRGVVHDDNAWAMSGTGTSGHAGLFGTLHGLLGLGCGLLEGLAGAKGTSLQKMLVPLVAERPGGSLRMGFDGISGPASFAGRHAGRGTFGHLGFTGTSIWCDPQKQRVVVLLSNRVWPHRGRPQIASVRPIIHDFLWVC